MNLGNKTGPCWQPNGAQDGSGLENTLNQKTKKKQEKADLFKQVLGSPRNVEEVEDE